MNLRQALCDLAGPCVEEQVPLSAYTTFGIGGPARYMVHIASEMQLAKLLNFLQAEQIPYAVLGNGSNVLAEDEGYDGVVLRMGRGFSEFYADKNGVYAQAGILLPRLFKKALEAGYTGLAFVSGIPGTLGGGVYMNAGAHGKTLSQVISYVDVLTPSGQRKRIAAKDCAFGQRESRFMHSGEMVIGAQLCLEKGDVRRSLALAQAYLAERRKKQPLEQKSAGSVFKHPKGHFAGALIEQAGLKGYAVGGVQVSQKHAGFIVNTGNATAKDVKALIKHIGQTVKAMYDITLETELCFLGCGQNRSDATCNLSL